MADIGDLINTTQDLRLEIITQDERIKELEDELEQHRWIPVSERLPKDGGLYLLAKDFDKGEDMWMDIYGSGSSGFNTIKDYIDTHHITHWKQIILP